MRSKLLGSIVAGFILLFFSNSDATIITFFGEDLSTQAPDGGYLPPADRVNSSAAESDFLSHLIDPITEDFEGFAEGTTSASGSPIPTAVGHLIGNATVDALGPSEVPGDRYPTSGSQFINTDRSEFGDFNQNDPLAVALNPGTTAFGLWATDVGDFSGQLVVAIGFLTLPPQIFALGTTNPHVGGSSLFFGLISSAPIDHVVFGTSNGDDFFGYDDFTVASATVPEPGSVILIGSGLLAIGWRVRSQRAV